MIRLELFSLSIHPKTSLVGSMSKIVANLLVFDGFFRAFCENHDLMELFCSHKNAAHRKNYPVGGVAIFLFLTRK